MAESVIAQIMFLNLLDPDTEMLIHINSPGGSYHAGLAIYNVMQQVSNDVKTLVYGMAASAASLVLCGGAAGKRQASPNSTIMIHQMIMGEYSVSDRLKTQTVTHYDHMFSP